MESQLPTGMSQDSMMQQAQHIWSMLDDMAANNPAGYRKFLDKQMKEGKEHMKPPKPHMCIQTIIYNDSGREEMLYINVFEWHRIPNAKDDESSIPVMGGSMYSGQDEEESHKLVPVAFNPEILEKFGLHSKLVEEKRMLINLAIDYLNNQHKVEISRHYTTLNEDNICKGSPKLAINSLMKKTGQDDKEFEQQLNELEKTFGPAAQGCKESLLNKLSNLAVDETDQSESFNSNHVTLNNEPEIKMPGQPTSNKLKKVLVQEISGGNVRDSKLPEPIYELTTKVIKGETKMVLTIQLPGVTSVQQCELDISQDDVMLQVPDQYELQLQLSQEVDNLSAAAKFNKKTSTLTLSLPVITSPR